MKGEILDYMNFPPNFTDNLIHYPLEKVDKVQVNISYSLLINIFKV
jgi:hypothetical protein